ncbi:DUF975 family protein [Latilactobacillus sakei]|uniref:DUF975 family protein n=1 Tax=Latilactobacillus sakei TaxID=1599 RepID=UPI003F53B786
MQLRTYRATARQLLKGHWQMMATLVIIWLLVEMGTDTLLQSLFETNSFGYQMLNTFANYLFYFVFLNAVFLAAYKLTIKKETRLSDTLVLFRPPFYTHLIILNFIQQLLNWALTFIGLAPFHQLISWQRVFRYTYNGITSMAPYIMQISQNPKQYTTVLAFLLVILTITFLQLLILMYYQILVLIKFDFPQVSMRMLLSLSVLILKGHWLKLLGLGLSFIGWELLVYLTAGIGFIWFYPYLIVSVTAFYQDIKQQRIQIIQ